MSPRFVDCNGLAGGMSLGFIQAGLTLAHRCGDLKLGAKNFKANRQITGWDWEDQFSEDPTDWHVPNDVDVVMGSPPCAGFSTMTRAEFRGINSPANIHMKRLMQYAGRVAPKIVAFESVQQAYSGGRELMTLLRDKLEADTGYEYNLYHVLHNVATLGGAAQRKRYFFVASRIPFGMDPPIPYRVPTLLESIGDLRGLSSTWERQPYVYPDTWWSSRRRSADGTVDGHKAKALTHAKRIAQLVDALDGHWPEGWREEDAVKAIYKRDGCLPSLWQPSLERLLSRNFDMGFNQMGRWYGDQPARVLTGSALDQAMHPTETRMFTFREAMRIQGWPDNWKLWPMRKVPSHSLFAGKGVSVDAGRWLGIAIREALEGTPGYMKGLPDGDREFTFNSTKNYKLAPLQLGRRVLI